MTLGRRRTIAATHNSMGVTTLARVCPHGAGFLIVGQRPRAPNFFPRRVRPERLFKVVHQNSLVSVPRTTRATKDISSRTLNHHAPRGSPRRKLPCASNCLRYSGE